jgi:hypothetical protein
MLLASSLVLLAPSGLSDEPLASATISHHEPPTDDADAWYYLDSEDKEQGPFAHDLLSGWVQEGKVPGETQVKHTKAGTLHAASMSFDRDYSKLRVKELKKLLRERGVQCKGCGEKSHLVQRVQETIHLPVLPPPPPPPEKPLNDIPDLSNVNIPGKPPS